MSVGTYSVLSLKRARICFRQLSQARRRWAGAPLQQEGRSQCVKSRVQSPKSFLPLHCTEAENELFPPRRGLPRLRLVDPGECRDGLTILT